jgi:hypothetical protein
MSFQDLDVQMTNLRGDVLKFGWQGIFTINGIEQPTTGFKHIENPYCTAELNAKTIDISNRGNLLRLNFEG